MHKTFLLCVVAPAASQDLQDLHSNPAATALLRALRRPSLPAGRGVGAESRERSSPAQHHLFIQVPPSAPQDFSSRRQESPCTLQPPKDPQARWEAATSGCFVPSSGCVLGERENV